MKFWLVWLAMGSVYAQSALTFEVASVKPNTSMEQNSSLNRTPSGGLSARNVTLRTLVVFAYQLQDYQLAGGPVWLDSDHYDVEAKAPANAVHSDPANFFDDSAMPQIRQRLQSLLAERFQLAVHWGTKEMATYALVVEKSGAKLQPWKEADGPGPSMRGEYTRLTCRKYTMERFAKVIGQHLGRPVTDRTGLTGEYTIAMTFEPERQRALSTEAPTGPSFVEALRDQLGLKLEAGKGPVEILVIDRAEKASAN